MMDVAPLTCKNKCANAEFFSYDNGKVLEELAFVDFIVFGKWNYDVRSSTPEAKEEYLDYVYTFRDFCKANNIRYHVKSETLKFIGEVL
jgi:hypothetical protein